MTTKFRTCLGVGIFTVVIGVAMAQGDGPAWLVGDGPGWWVLLPNASVQKELKLDDMQVEKAKELAKKIQGEMREKSQELQGLDGEERLTKMAEMTREFNAKTLKEAGKFLTPNQIKRLNQISNQRRGFRALNQPEVAKELNLTIQQKADIKEIARQARANEPTVENFQVHREASIKKAHEINKQAFDKAKAKLKLTEKQQNSWEKLFGPPFEIRWLPDTP